MPKLPADLPENWTRGQIVSPNGTETGLTEQHGYNYLMKQVNNTQTEVNNINGALPDVAQQATVNEINNKIGTESDADTQPTLFGRLAQLKNVLVEKLAEVLTKVTGIDNKIDKLGKETKYFPTKTLKETLYEGKKLNKDNTLIAISRIAEYDGIIRFEIDVTNTSTNGVAIFAFSEHTHKMNMSPSKTGQTGNTDRSIEFSERGEGTNVSGPYISGTGVNYRPYFYNQMGTSQYPCQFFLEVKKGYRYAVLLQAFNTPTIEYVKVYYETKEV